MSNGDGRADNARSSGIPGDGHHGNSLHRLGEQFLDEIWPLTHAIEPDEVHDEIRFIDSATFARTEYHLEWGVQHIMMLGQPLVIGGLQKTLKTSVAIDLLISLGTGEPFLGHDPFGVPRPLRVGFLSGESGAATIKETALRIRARKEIELAAANVDWGFRLPQLSRDSDLDALAEAIRDHEFEVLALDPLYLCLRPGDR